MRILRNIFIALAYLLGIIALVVVFITRDNLALIFALASIGFTLLALLFAGRLKRKFIRIPLIIGLLGVVLAYALPTLFPSKVDDEITSVTESRSTQADQEFLELEAIDSTDVLAQGDEPESQETDAVNQAAIEKKEEILKNDNKQRLESDVKEEEAKERTDATDVSIGLTIE